MKRFLLLSSMVAALFAGSAQAKDVALIIANSDYQRLSDMRDVRGLRNLSGAFDGAGYEVLSIRNADVSGMVNAARQASRVLEPGDKLVVVLGGHVASAGDAAYLLGISARSPDGFDVGLQGMPISAFMELAAGQAGTSIVAIATPSTRANYRAGLSAGLTQRPEAQGVTVITGSVRSLAQAVNQLAVGNAPFAQVAAQNDSVISGYIPNGVFGQSGTAADELTDRDFWQVAQMVNTVDGYEAYLDEFPNGEFANQADDRIADFLDSPRRQAEQAEAALGLSRQAARQVQSDLTVLGFDTRGVDGVFGPGTRKAITAWQSSQGFAASSYLTREQYDALTDQAADKRADLEEAAAAQAAAVRAADRAFWRETGRGRNERGLKRYLARYPDGQYAEIARERLAEFEPEPAPEPAGPTQAQMNTAQAQEKKILANPLTRVLAETGLQRTGLNPGRVDGRFDDNTRRAILEFQKRHGLLQTGYLDAGTAQKLLNNQ